MKMKKACQQTGNSQEKARQIQSKYSNEYGLMSFNSINEKHGLPLIQHE